MKLLVKVLKISKDGYLRKLSQYFVMLRLCSNTAVDCQQMRVLSCFKRDGGALSLLFLQWYWITAEKLGLFNPPVTIGNGVGGK